MSAMQYFFATRAAARRFAASQPVINPLSLMHRTPDGGYAVSSGKEREFEAIPCRHSTNRRSKTDTYHYANGVKLRIAWGGEEFDLV